MYAFVLNCMRVLVNFAASNVASGEGFHKRNEILNLAVARGGTPDKTAELYFTKSEVVEMVEQSSLIL